MSQYNEPWKIKDDFQGVVADQLSFTGADGNSIYQLGWRSGRDYMERVVACVNFCAGLDDDTLRGEPLLHSLTYYRGWLWNPEDETWGNAIPGNTAEPPYWIPSANRSLTKHATHDGTRPLLSAFAIARPAE